MPRKLSLFIAMSEDGFITGANESLSFLSMVEVPGEDYNYARFLETIDCILIGRKTYDAVINMGFDYPHQGKKVFIISRTAKPAIGSFEYYHDDLNELVSYLKMQNGKNIYCDGGASIIHQLLALGQIDQMIISVIPVKLGEGVLLFAEGNIPENFTLLTEQKFPSGLLQKTFVMPAKPKTQNPKPKTQKLNKH